MELGERETLFRSPLHPYTDALLSAVPMPDPAAAARRNRVVLRGDVVALRLRGQGLPLQAPLPGGAGP